MRLLALSLAMMVTSLFAGEPPAPSAGEQAYAKGEFAGAVEAWQAEAQRDGVSPGLLAALGNAEWRLGRKGRAMVCWERALLLDPYNAVALAGIRHGQNAGGVERPGSTWSENYSAVLSADLWLIIAAVSFWAALLAILLPRLRRQPASEWNQRIRVTAFTLLALCIPGLWGARSSANRAVVRKTEISLRLTPTLQGEPTQAVSEGDVVRTGRGFNGHIRVTTADGKSGWLRAGEIESVWGHSLPADLDQKAAP
jgi:hypothetical protein